ncbi:hypothetical protein J4217_04020 [Candidatus Pacearchaeota archaeon]|nr:hypothetical protein [Candidatus Pacearchaeota archaeon]
MSHTPEGNSYTRTYVDVRMILAQNEDRARVCASELRSKIQSKYNERFFWDSVNTAISNVHKVEAPPGFKIVLEPLEQKVSSEKLLN